MLGLATAVLAVVALFRRWARYATAVAGALVLLSAFVIHHRTPVAWWNDVLVGAAIALVSLVPGTMYSLRRRRVAA